MSVQELEEMLQRASANGREISKEDFYNIMTKKTFWSASRYLIVYSIYEIDSCLL